jgi:RHS repeat-associated protein
VTYTYDEASGGFGKGRLTSLTDAAGSLQRVYDERGNVVKETRSRLGASLTTGYAYDAASRLAVIAYPSGWTASYARDQMGRITALGLGSPGGAALPPSFAPPPAPGLMLAGPAMPALRAPGGTTVVSSITYLPFGPVSGLTYGNGIAETRSSDLDYRQTALNASGSAAVQNLGYGYDADNNVTAIADGIASGNSQNFGYDVLNRLVIAAGGYGTIAYSYDLVGNLATRQTTAGNQSATENFGYLANSNRLASMSQNNSVVRQFIYTPTCNVAFDNSSTSLGLAYNGDNRLAGVTTPSLGLLYTYDAFGQRLSKTIAGIPQLAVFYQYDRAGHLIEEGEWAGAPDMALGGAKPNLDYLYLGDQPIALLYPALGSLEFLHDDRLGTPQLATTTQQGTAWAANYNPFGRTQLQVNLLVQNLRFPGQYADLETGYYHNGFRDYDPSLGRYLQSDPFGLIGGLNTYLYAEGRPTTLVDPFGAASRSYIDNNGNIHTFDQDTPAGYPANNGFYGSRQRTPSEKNMACFDYAGSFKNGEKFAFPFHFYHEEFTLPNGEKVYSWVNGTASTPGGSGDYVIYSTDYEGYMKSLGLIK